MFECMYSRKIVGTLFLNVDVETHRLELSEGLIKSIELVSERCPFSNYDFLAFCKDNTHVGFGLLNPSRDEIVLEIEILSKKFYAVLPNDELAFAA